METFENESAEAHYSSFSVDGRDGYKLLVSGYSGTAGDGMSYHNEQFFTTYDNDQDNDGQNNCAQLRTGGWWYNACFHSNPNGQYLHGQNTLYGKGIIWRPLKGVYYSMKSIEFKVKRNET